MFVVDSHHKVLSAWAEYRNTIENPPRLITLDHHTDTSKPFRNYIKQMQIAEEKRKSLVSAIDYKNSKSVLDAVAKLSNDEHIIAAIEADIISSAFVIAHNAMDTDIEVYREHKIMCRSVGRIINSQNATREECNRVLESDFLSEMIVSFNRMLEMDFEKPLLSEKYILDIDLDYFNTFASVKPQDATFIKSLARNAGLITIATEPEYVKNNALDVELSSDFLLFSLFQLI